MYSIILEYLSKKKKKNPEYVSKAYLLLSGQEMSHGISNIFKQLLDTNIENIIKCKVLFWLLWEVLKARGRIRKIRSGRWKKETLIPLNQLPPSRSSIDKHVSAEKIVEIIVQNLVEATKCLSKRAIINKL